VHQHLVAIHEAFDEAERLQLVPRNRVSRMKKFSVTGYTEQHVLEEDEVREVLEAARGTRLDMLLRFTLVTGLRIGEVFGRTWSDVDFDGRILLVEGNARFRTGSGVVMDTLKTKNARRLIELSPETVTLLTRQRTVNAEARLAAGPVWLEHDLLFYTTVGTPQHPRESSPAIVGSSGVDVPRTVGFHTFRHTAAALWIKSASDIYAVSRRLGHADAAFTMNVYGHLLKGMQVTAAGAMDHLIAG
jgi:integrase